MPHKSVRKPPVEAFVNQDAHRLHGVEHREFPSFDDGDCLLALDGGRATGVS